MDRPCTLYWIRLPEHVDPASEGYIGITVKPPKVRFNEHVFSSLPKAGHRRKTVGMMLGKYGRDGVVLQVLGEGTRAECLAEERRLRPFPGIGWNRGPGGIAPGEGRVVSEETRRKLAAVHLGKPKNPEAVEKMRAALTGRKGVSRPVPEERRKRISEALTGRKLSDETRKKIGDANRGRKRDREAVERGAAKHRGRVVGEEGRRKMSESALKPEKCPHCGKEGPRISLRRWHFNNCPLKADL